MKNKKGFTLIELLAVIVVLAIILVIAIPKIMTLIERARIGSMDSSAKLIAKSVENNYQASLTKDLVLSSTGSCMGNLDANEYKACTYSITDGKATISLTGSDSGKFSNYICIDSTKTESSCRYNLVCPAGYKVEGTERTDIKCVSNTYNVTFDSNGGSTPSFTTTTIENDKKVGELPTVTYEGHTFIGWYTKKYGGTKVTEDTILTVTSDMTFYAIWDNESYALTLNSYPLTFTDYTGFELVDENTIVKEIKVGDTYGELPTPSGNNYIFEGWYLDPLFTTKVTSDMVVESSSHSLFPKINIVVARIGTTEYSLLSGAIASITDSTKTTITMVNNTKENVTFPLNTNIVLDTSNTTITGLLTVKGNLEITGNGKITNSEECTLEDLTSSKASSYTMYINNGILTITSGTIENNASTDIPNRATILSIDSDITMNGGNVLSTGNSIKFEQRNATSIKTLTINDGIVETTNNNAIEIDATTTDLLRFNINGGEITSTSSSAMWIKNGIVTINDGTITGNVSNSGIVSVGNNTLINTSNPTVTYNGGDIISTNETKDIKFIIGSGTLNIESSLSSTLNSTIYALGGTTNINNGTISNSSSNPTITLAGSGTLYPVVNVYSDVENTGTGLGIKVVQGILNVYDGNLISNNNTIYSFANGTVNISGGEISSTVSYAVIYSLGTLNISDNAVITAVGFGISQASGIATITGGTITTTGANASLVIGKSGYTPTVNMSGGTITQNGSGTTISITTGTFNLSGGTINGGASAQTIYVSANTSFNQTGGTINSKNTSLNNYGTTTLSGGVISNTGNYFAIKNYKTLTLNDDIEITSDGGGISQLSGTTTITGGMLTTGSSNSINIYKSSESSVVNMTGGVITQNGSTIAVAVSKGGEFNLSGGTINATTSSIYGVSVSASGAIFNMSGGEINSVIEAVYNKGTTTISGGTLTSTGTSSVHGALSSTNTLTISNDAVITSNTYGLLILRGTTTIEGGTITGKTMGIYANSPTINMTGGVVTASTSGNALYLAYGTFNMTGGTLVGNTSSYVINSPSSGTVNLSGGEVKSNASYYAIYSLSTLTISDNALINAKGAGVGALSGTTTIEGGTINGGGSSVSLTVGKSGYTPTVNMTGGTINNTGTNKSVNIATGTFNLSGGIINGNSSDIALYVTSGATFNQTGGTINSSYVGVLNYGTSTISNGEIKHTFTKYSAIESYGELTISDNVNITSSSVGIYSIGNTTITGGTITTTGANSSLIVGKSGYTPTVNMTGGTINNTGTGIVVSIDTGTFNMTGGTLVGNTSNYVINNASIGTFNLSGGEVKSNASYYALYSLGTLTISDNAVINAKGAGVGALSGTTTIEGGTINGRGSSVSLTVGKSGYTPTVNMTGGTINNTGTNKSVNIATGTFNLSGGIINGNSSDIALYVTSGATFNQTGGEINSSYLSVKTLGITSLSSGTINYTGSIYYSVESLGTLTISGDINITSSNTSVSAVSGTTTINGGTITSTGANPSLKIGDTGYTPIVNMTGGTINNTGTGRSVNIVVGTFNLSGGVINGNSNAYAVYVTSGATFNQTGGTINSSYVGVLNYGTSTISNGEIKHTFTNYSAIESYGELTISDNAKITSGATCINMSNSETTTINGGTISNTSLTYPALYVYGGTLTISDNANISSLIQTIGVKELGTLNITGGTITSQKVVLDNEGTATLTGGTIIGDLGAGSGNSYAPISSIGTLIVDGTVNITASNTPAIIDGGTSYIKGGTITNNSTKYCTLQVGYPEETDSMVMIGSGNMTFTGGTIINNSTNSESVKLVVVGLGSFNMQDGSLTSNYAPVGTYVGGIINMSGGTISTTSTSYPAISLYGTLNMTGGTISGSKYSVNYSSTATYNKTGGTVTPAALQAYS